VPLLRKWISWFLLPICLLGPPLLGLYGALSPWQPSEEALSTQAGRTKLLVGISYRGGSTQDGPYARRARTYAFLPEGLRRLETVSVVQENGKVRTEVQHLGLVVPLLAFTLGLLGSLWQLYRLASTRRIASAR
jgi:hypothetical protein